jgi:hypothetical protein
MTVAMTVAIAMTEPVTLAPALMARVIPDRRRDEGRTGRKTEAEGLGGSWSDIETDAPKGEARDDGKGAKAGHQRSPAMRPPALTVDRCTMTGEP